MVRERCTKTQNGTQVKKFGNHCYMPIATCCIFHAYVVRIHIAGLCFIVLEIFAATVHLVSAILITLNYMFVTQQYA